LNNKNFLSNYLFALKNYSLLEEVKFGDACIAAPFTSKYSNSIKCVITIIKQGISHIIITKPKTKKKFL
jgi:hypothetical protein